MIFCVHNKIFCIDRRQYFHRRRMKRYEKTLLREYTTYKTIDERCSQQERHRKFIHAAKPGADLEVAVENMQ